MVRVIYYTMPEVHFVDVYTNETSGKTKLRKFALRKFA